MEIEIEEDIYERLKQRAQQNEFDTTHEYINVVLAEFLSEIGSRNDDRQQGNLEERLEDLGYL